MRSVVIVGGGLAGLTLGILLRRNKVPVQLWEALPYPRHRVCGEFISGAGVELLLELIPELRARSLPIRTVRFYHLTASTPTLCLPSAGLSVSRWELDSTLARKFQEEGGKLIQQRWTEPMASEGLIRATGRRRNGARAGWTGLKIHAHDLSMPADLEMHFSSHGYLGISRLPTGGANLCALVNESFGIRDFKSDPSAVLTRLVGCPDTAERLGCAQLEPESSSAVTGITFGGQSPSNECCIGDGVRMIPPFTGNGMSLAIESAFIAAPLLEEFSSGQKRWEEVADEIRLEQSREFRMRFAGASTLRYVAERSWTRHLMMSILKTVPGALSICFGATRR